MSDIERQGAEGVRIIARRVDGSEVDVTSEVRLVYELLNESLDYGSGFLSIEDVTEITRLALAAGFVSIPDADKQLMAYIRTVSPHCPTCGDRSYGYQLDDVTVDGRLMTLECGHQMELVTPPGQPASVRPVPEQSDGGDRV